MAVFKRIYRLTIEINGVLKTFQELEYTDNSLKIDFDIQVSTTGAFSNGNITIYGLNRDDMQFLSTCYNPQNGRLKRNKITLEVGYYPNLSLIFKGNTLETEADFQSEDKKITFKIMGGAGNSLSKQKISTSLSGNVDFKTICNEVAKNNGLSLLYDSKILKRVIADYSFLGSAYQQINNLRTFFNDLDIFINETGEQLKVLLKENGEILRTDELSNKTGLIGTPKPINKGLLVKSLLNVNFKAGQHIKLKNEYLTDFNGTYRIFSVTHRGSNKGEIWETELLLRRLKNG